MENKFIWLGIAGFIGLAFLISKILKKGVQNMDVVYATLIINGYRTFAQVPTILKPRVKAALEALGMAELATE